MADTTTTVNGVYGNQYAQPAELAATTPSAPSHAPSGSQSTSASATAQKADPQEIGWYFVEQYYTTLSKSPERIHLFYNKRSQLVTGVEAEKVIPAVGAKAISEKIRLLHIQDCKVRVLNVDSQASFSNIVVQVIGEMSNNNQPHHKFVQTFVLAEQPNGYFVLNDIFRYLSDDEDEIVEDEPAQPEVPAEEPPTPAEPNTDAPPAYETVATEEAAEMANEELEDTKEEEDDTNPEIADAVAETNADTDADPEGEVDNTEDVSAVSAAEPTEEETEGANHVEEPEPKAPVEVAAPEPSPLKAATPVPEAPPAKKTWASMVGGKAPTLPAIPSQTPTTTQAKAPRPVQQPQPQPPKPVPIEPAAASPVNTQGNGWQMADGGKKGRSTPQTKATEGNTLAYIKNVNDKVDARTLREVLETYGELKYFDVARPRNCAFVEFATPEGYAAAVASNPHTVGSETISVEERRPRPGAYGGSQANFGRGNGTAGRGGRGNMQQRTNSQTGFPKDAGRGGFQQQRGSKSGNVTPKGRGQPQAA